MTTDEHSRPEQRFRWHRVFMLALVVGVMVLTVVVADRARSVADERRQAQVELQRAQSASQQVRAVAAEALNRGQMDAAASGEVFVASTRLIESIGRLRALGVRGEVPDRLDATVGRFYNVGLGAFAASRSKDLDASLRQYKTQVEPMLAQLLADTEAQSAVEDRRAQEAARVARWVLIGGILAGLVLLTGIVRRLDAIVRRGRIDDALHQQAFTDALTGFPNRAGFEVALAERLTPREGLAGEAGRLALSPAAAAPLATIAVLDVDDLKSINDGLGHGAGDEVVRAFGARIEAALQPGDVVCRFGGDEFGILFASGDDRQAVASLGRVLATLQKPMTVSDREVRLTASAGVASGSEPEVLVRDADIAMYAAKAAGKDRVVVFEEAMREDALANLELAGDLRMAVERGEFFLEYQPLVDLEDGRTAGVEALVRWQHPERGRVPPLAFIGLAERTGLIGPLGWWVMDTACRQMVAWIREGAAVRGEHVSVNVSPLQLAESGFAARVEGVLEVTGLSPRQLQLEITESVLVDRPEALVADLTELMALGVRIAIDDFGTGHSVLAYLKDLPVDVLKIDKAFVDEIQSDAGRARLTQGIVQLAQGMGLSIVAEGIEHAEQADVLHGLGRMLGQGYLYSRPVAAERAGELLRDGLFGETAPVPAEA